MLKILWLILGGGCLAGALWLTTQEGTWHKQQLHQRFAAYLQTSDGRRHPILSEKTVVGHSRRTADLVLSIPGARTRPKKPRCRTLPPATWRCGTRWTTIDEIDKNTYDIFELKNGVPTYGYELAQAVKDGFLVDFLSVESKLKFLEEGIAYDDLSEEEKATYEATFTDENGELPQRIDSSALNEWLFNEDTIRLALNLLMTNGLNYSLLTNHLSST